MRGYPWVCSNPKYQLARNCQWEMLLIANMPAFRSQWWGWGPSKRLFETGVRPEMIETDKKTKKTKEIGLRPIHRWSTWTRLLHRNHKCLFIWIETTEKTKRDHPGLSLVSSILDNFRICCIIPVRQTNPNERKAYFTVFIRINALLSRCCCRWAANSLSGSIDRC